MASLLCVLYFEVLGEILWPEIWHYQSLFENHRRRHFKGPLVVTFYEIRIGKRLEWGHLLVSSHHHHYHYYSSGMGFIYCIRTSLFKTISLPGCWKTMSAPGCNMSHSFSVWIHVESLWHSYVWYLGLPISLCSWGGCKAGAPTFLKMKTSFKYLADPHRAVISPFLSMDRKHVWWKKSTLN